MKGFCDAFLCTPLCANPHGIRTVARDQRTNYTKQTLLMSVLFLWILVCLMRLSLQTDYALRTLMYLASVSNRATIAEVAAFFQIPAPNVAKVVNQLARLGYVRSVRGIGGGIELGTATEAITIGEIVEAFEGSMHLLECVGTEAVCVIQSYCKLRNVLARAEQVQVDYLKSVKLSDVLPVKNAGAKRSSLRDLSRKTRNSK